MAAFFGELIMKKEAIFVFSENQLKYKFHEEHPFNPLRLRLTVDLLKEMNALQPEDIVEPRMASDEELKDRKSTRLNSSHTS